MSNLPNSVVVDDGIQHPDEAFSSGVLRKVSMVPENFPCDCRMNCLGGNRADSRWGREVRSVYPAKSAVPSIVNFVTGKMGLSRHLPKIVDQVILAKGVLPEGARISHRLHGDG